MLASVYNRNICVFVSTESSIDVDPIPSSITKVTPCNQIATV